MRRLCIYVTYNKENKIKEYMGYMLKAMRDHADRLYVTCNYPEIKEGMEYIDPYADGIFFRENKGFDAGAYKDMLCSLLGWDMVYQYDELILMNDSFLGPFYDIGRCFAQMENAPCDFWGMTRNFGGEYESFIGRYETHIQSYFLVLRGRVIQSCQFRDFWERLEYPNTYEETIFYFEHRLNNLLRDEGFVPMALTDVWGMTFKRDENPYRLYSLELIRDKGLPILKKKSIQITNIGFANALKAVYFVAENGLYPAEWIWDMIDSQFYIEGYAPDYVNCLEFFYKKFKKIYIYGAGVCGKNLTVYFRHKGWQYAGIIVSDKAGQDMECIAFDDVPVDKETGIIVSVIHKEMSDEIVRHIGNRCAREQIFVLYDCASIRLPEQAALDSTKKEGWDNEYRNDHCRRHRQQDASGHTQAVPDGK